MPPIIGNRPCLVIGEGSCLAAGRIRAKTRLAALWSFHMDPKGEVFALCLSNHILKWLLGSRASVLSSVTASPMYIKATQPTTLMLFSFAYGDANPGSRSFLASRRWAIEIFISLMHRRRPVPLGYTITTFGPWARLPLIFLSCIVIAFSLLSHPSVAQGQAPQPPYDEKQAQRIDRMIMCPVCPAETIDQAQVEISKQMRAIVREMLAEGKDRDDIFDFFVERYGKDILAAPPKSGANLVAWLMPVGGVGAALIAVFFIIRSMTQRGPAPATPRPVQDDGLAPYLQLVDRHLDIARGGGSSIWSGLRPGGTSNPPDPSVESPGTDPSGPDERG